MSQFWKKWKNPWTRSQAARRYIEGGDEIGIRKLASDSGISRSALETWSKQESWTNKRRQFQGRVEAATSEKTVEKTSEKLSDEFSEVAIANYKAHKLARDYATAVFQIKASHMQLILQSEATQHQEMLKSHNAHEMNFWSLILARATEGINQATGLSYYLSGNASVKRIEDMGGDIVFPQQNKPSTG